MEFLRETLCFGRYRLHPTQGLTRGKREIRITPKSLGVLRALAERPGQIVSKEELFRAVWPTTAVTDATLTSCIKELRQALNDDAQAPRYIETIHRRGFRFLASTLPLIPSLADRATSVLSVPGLEHIVGRAAPLDQLEHAFVRATQGRRQIVFVSGEPGIGKTALAELTRHRIATKSECVIARAECVQHYGPGEAYQPLLEILARLCRSPVRQELLRALRRCAPLWLAQLPALQTSSDARFLEQRIVGATSERMLRELTDAIEALSERTPLVLLIEDLHWADPSTLDWIASFARRPESARVLIVGTYRPGESTAINGLPDRLVNELHARHFCELIELAPLGEDVVVQYIVQRFPPIAGGEQAMQALARTVHQRTEGTPLFFVNVLDELIARSTLATDGGYWRVQKEISADEALLPPDLRRTIEQQISRVADDVRCLLDAACIVGNRFPAAAVAAGANIAADEAERKLSELARRRTLLRDAGSTEWPDGTVCATFEFAHALYADVLRDLLAPGRRTTLHRAVGLRLEAAFGVHAPQVAAELAMHFDSGLDLPRAIRFHEHAARNNLRLNAHEGARQHFRRALELLDGLEASSMRDELEINLRIGLGNVVMQTGGWAAAEVRAAYTRASELCHKHGATQRLFPALWNLWVFNAASGSLEQAHRLAVQLREIASSSNDPASMLQAHHANWATLYSLGDLAGCAAQASDGLRLYPADHVNGSDLEYGSHDCGVCARMFGARTLALSGKADAAARQVDDGLALAERLAHPFTQAFALTHAAAIHLELDDAVKCRDYGNAARAIASEWHFSLLDAWAACYVGASMVKLDEPAQGIAMIHQGIESARATGSEMFQSHLLGLLAEAQLRTRAIDEGLRCVEEAFAVSTRTGERFYVAELHRIKGELCLARNDSQSGGDEFRLLADQELRAALSIANSQQALLLAQRAALALARL